uniref:ABC transporter domain-containing protein n=1 Tax=Chenopodium quinoa TaxID=63459 RepID=A0A803MQI7_CHEQI
MKMSAYDSGIPGSWKIEKEEEKLKIYEKKIDVQKMGRQEMKMLVDNLLAKDDHQNFLRQIRDRFDRVGVEIPKIEVRFENLSVKGDVHVGSRALPTLFNSTINSLEAILGLVRVAPSNKKTLNILHQVNGIIRPSRMTLLLGPPSSGKTTLLLALAGKLDRDLKVNGKITYCGHDLNEFVPKKTCAYVSQNDLHYGEMTVRETLVFSGQCLGVGAKYELLQELLKKESEAGFKSNPELDAYMKGMALEGHETSLVTEYLLKILGLDRCANTVVGDDMRRGISGGERKRLTIGEMIAGPAKVLLMDEISTGLDSSTTYQICKYISEIVHIMDMTTIISLLQPTPQVYELFDDIILISDGQIVYQGPREYVLDFFEYVGFKCPERKEVASFLQEVTSKKDQPQYWFKDQKYHYVSIPELVEAFRSFHVGQKLALDLRVPYLRERTHPLALVKENYKTTMHHATVTDGEKYLGVIFLSMSNFVLNGMAETTLTVIGLPIFYKQRDSLFYPSWGYALPIWVLRIPVSFFESILWTVLTYYTIGYAPGVTRFFYQWLAYFSIYQMALSFFRSISAIGRTIVIATTACMILLLLMFVLSGFVIAKGDISPWMLWAYYVSPMMYGQHALVINEFLDKRWNIEMRSLGYEGDRLQLLQDVSGAFRPGVLTALIGVTGAGKTTLMDVLAGKKTRGYVEGSIYVSGYPKNQETFARISGYCEQIDIHSPHLTVYESLLYSAWLRLSSNINQNTRMRFIEEVMRLIELEPLRDAIVGLPGINGLSIEQRKRLTIAVELVANPSILFMDEPTSGLDARAAAIVMRTMKSIKNTGRTIVCTIHQPSVDIFEAFDELLLMKRGGQIIYSGPLGDNSYKLIEYFEDIPGVPKNIDGYNPATWVLDITSPQEESKMGLDFAQIYAKSQLYQMNEKIIKEFSSPPQDSKDLLFATKYSQSFLVQFQACFWKQHRSYWQNPSYTCVRLFMTVFMGALLGLIFWDKGGKFSKLQDLKNLLGIIYSAIVFLAASNALNVQAVFASERTVFYRERAAKMYSSLPFALAQLAIETIYLAIVNCIYALILYSMIGFEWTTMKFFYFYYFIFMCFTYHTLLGLMLVSLTPRHEFASIFMTFFATFWNIFAGFFLPRPQIPIWWRWCYWASPVSWTMYGMVTSQIGDKSSPIEILETNRVPLNILLNDFLGYDFNFLPIVVVAHLLWVVFFLLVFTCGVKFLNFQKR